MHKEANRLVSFKDLMQAKMDREQRVDSPKEVPEEMTPSAPRAVSAVSLPRAVNAPSAGSQKPTSPEKDFTKVANSIVRQIPLGVFVGKSKQMYDYLYSVTRGAIKPTRTIRISKTALMRGSGIKSTHTFYNNVRHLEEIGLIVITRIDGEKSGNQYEVLLPEEISDPGQLAHLEQLAQVEQPAQLTALTQKLPVAPNAETALTALGSTPINTGVLDVPKTSFKDNTKNDDDARARGGFALMIGRLDAAAKKFTGKGVTKREAEAWGNLAELLVLELEVAARRTENISSVPAFLTEVLRRQFFSARQQQVTPKLSKVKKDTVGKSDSVSYEIKPLDKKGREEALIQLREFAADEFLQDFKKWYTTEDWQWLMKQLEIE